MMPNFILQKRNSQLSELMDDPACDPKKLANTYKNFALINKLLSGWNTIYKNYIRPLNPQTLLDIGCGGGDIARAIAVWAKQDGLELNIIAIDPDKRAFEFARNQANPPNVAFRQASSSDLRREGQRFDVVISNHLLHHLGNDALHNLCDDSKALSNKIAIHNDLRRSDLAYASFLLSAPLFLNSFITPDGLHSIRRSFTPDELKELLSEEWQVKPLFPFRNLLLCNTSLNA